MKIYHPDSIKKYEGRQIKYATTKRGNRFV